MVPDFFSCCAACICCWETIKRCLSSLFCSRNSEILFRYSASWFSVSESRAADLAPRQQKQLVGSVSLRIYRKEQLRFSSCLRWLFSTWSLICRGKMFRRNPAIHSFVRFYFVILSSSFRACCLRTWWSSYRRKYRSCSSAGSSLAIIWRSLDIRLAVPKVRKIAEMYQFKLRFVF